ncbi:lipopolysaccharide cholinephosphotransferase licd [Plakobranchus ocellatus]|uniref:Lipopolysaccharide cholinephosphotransferase licd n=1 Tax=Plakobranchus ocellatus TaxID=259542 RepID=A0AAV4A4B8_9GAST|nr:lipopolysaccharide cholinephosphotransferase licd [Plakobranchus ocellatus]
MRIGNFLMIAAFSPRPHAAKDLQAAPNSHSYGWWAATAAKRLFCLLALVGITAAAVVCLRQPGQLYTNVPSWRDVSMLQIMKMHLAPRPSHVNKRLACPEPLNKPGISLENLDTSGILFNNQAIEKLQNLRPEENWKTAFAPTLDRQEKLELVHLYAVFKNAMESAGLRHVVMHGSALGAWRFHGVTPWDDDIDLAIDVADWVEIKETLGCIDGFSLDTTSNTKWGFYRNNGSLIKDDPSSKRWPFLDLFLYTSDDEYVWGLNYVHLRRFTFSKEDMFPTQLVPFEGFMVPVPRHLRNVLEHQFVDPTVCVSQHLNHRTGDGLEILKVPCQNLTDMYPMYFTNN